MDLFKNEIDSLVNLLPKDGIVEYYGKIFAATEANRYFNCLMNTIEWKNDLARIYGKLIVTKREVAWYGDADYEYTYSNITKRALPWTAELYILKSLVEKMLDAKFNSCLLNLYHNGEEGMAWHSDSERDLKMNGVIGSLSFGAERKFAFKHKETKETVSLILEHGGLLVMRGTTQTNWLHRLPPTRHLFQPRINLTFRTIEEGRQKAGVV